MTLNNTLAALSNAAQILVKEMEDRLKPGEYPAAIKDSIFIDPPQEDQGNTSIEITLGGEDAPMAAAFEWGSGERAERGNKQDYPITARNAPYLYFTWQYPSPLGRKDKPFTETVAFDSVMHPGIAPRPYIRPSIEEKKDEIKQVLGQAFKIDLLIGTARVTTIEVNL